MAELQYISITPLLTKLLDPSSYGIPSAEEISAALALIFENRLSTAQCASFLTLLQSTGRGTDSKVVARCAVQMRNAGAQIDRQLLRTTIRRRNMKAGSYRGGLCDIVGTGGDGHSTFNVSTTASIIASSLLLVCKHGAKASSSKSGAADMLQAIAPNAPVIEAITAKSVPNALKNGNYAFLFAPVFHPGAKFCSPIRRDLGFRTIFNILGPLANPTEQFIEARVCGVARRDMGRMYAEVLKMNGARKTLVVCGAENLDEISCAGKTFCWRLKERPNPDFRGPNSLKDEDYTTSDEDAPPQTLVDIEEFQLEPEDFGLPSHALSEVLPGREPQENAQTLIELLSNQLPRDDPILHFVLMNVAALLVVSGLCDENASSMGDGDTGEVIKEETGPDKSRWKEGVRRARWAIESGAALKSLVQYIEFTNSL